MPGRLQERGVRRIERGVAGVFVESLDTYCADEPREGLVLGFGALPLDQIPEALNLLQSAVRRVA
ncbi:MAG TPA: hypothetical protein VGO65_12725 [Pseudolysinimonas sp.]|nr:hypothetical protein [Pseudolysinimonas sp.]